MVSKVKLNINGKTVEIDKGKTILQAANLIGIRIPTLCHDPRLEPFAACRVCMVEIERGKSNALITSCNTEVTDGMVIRTDSEKVLNTRKMVMELILSDHPRDCMTCEKCGSCKLQDLAYGYGVRESRFFEEPDGGVTDDRNTVIQQDTSKCILCGDVFVFVLKYSRIMRSILRTADLKPKQEHPLRNQGVRRRVCYVVSVCLHVLLAHWSRNRPLERGGIGNLNRSKPPAPIVVWAVQCI